MKINKEQAKSKSRRKFIKAAGKAAVVAPAAGIILSASKAQARPGVQPASFRPN